MDTQKSKTVFVEYSSFDKGQHFMTVIQIQDHKRTIIGRIYKEYSVEEKKTIYRAEDFAGNKIFADIKDLYTLKKNFKEHGQNLAYLVPAIPGRAKTTLKHALNNKPERQNELKQARNPRTTKEKQITDTKSNPKTKDNSKADEINSNKKERDRNLAEIRNNHYSNEKVLEKEEVNISPIKDEQNNNNETDEKSEREMELEQIREESEEKEQDLELER